MSTSWLDVFPAVQKMQQPSPSAEGTYMIYTAEELALVLDYPANRILELHRLGIIDVAPNVLLLRPDTRPRCWVVVNPVVSAAMDAVMGTDG